MSVAVRIRRARVTMPLIAASLLVGSGLSAWALGQGSAYAATPAAAEAADDDFNGDGFGDLVVGAPGGTVSGQAKAGYVAVTYGSQSGLDPARKKIISRSTSGVPGAATAKQEFGRTFTKGDLDKDGYADLVVGADGRGATGGAVILWGSASGLTGGTKIDTYGFAPQAGDFDGDGTTDLALFAGAGVYGDDPVTQKATLWKGPVARTGTPADTLDFMDKSQWWSYEREERPDPACAEQPETCVDGPLSVAGPVVPEAVGDINGDGRADIAMNDYSGDGEWGNGVLYGSATGFKRASAPGSGGALGVGDINGDHYDDLVVGDGDYESRVAVAYGSADGLKEGTQKFDQNLPGVPGSEEAGDAFGASVAVGDVTGDGYADVALGVIGEDVRDVADAGAVVLVRGSANGVTGTGAQAFHQDTAGIPGVAEKGDSFGAAAALLDVTGDGHSDLAVSSVAENAQAGALWSLRGTANGLTATGSVAFGPKDVAAPNTAALFGSTLR
ncbi:FG-GAP and VCBS repeat-containing protein [Streptomyces sp. NPDC050658]|uniref:FG-GAP and VCBS repeat-containing protein n=1 Tax=unclassified Streptomyces TaxID=2593676 RepID=UPI003422AC9A